MASVKQKGEKLNKGGLQLNTLVGVLRNKYGLSGVKMINRLQANGSREVIHFSSNEGHWIVKILEHARREEEVQSYTKVLQFLGQLPERITPVILQQQGGSLYAGFDDRFLYVLEFIDGDKVSENPEDEFQLGVLASRLHAVEGYQLESNLRFKDRVQNMTGWFKDKCFYSSYARYIYNFPDFDLHRQCLIHTDIGPHNAMKKYNGQLIFIDLDDAGIGSKYIDLGYPLICQFVRFHNSKLKFDELNAIAFYRGYQLNHLLNEDEIELTFQGAVFMQMMYMNSFGDNAIDAMWSILKYGLNNKELLKSAIRGDL